MRVTGVVLAAGAGTRFGMPKALVVRDGTAWVEQASLTLLEAGCSEVVVVLGAAAASARALVPPAVRAVTNDDWASGMASSLAVGLASATGGAALVTLVDLPGLPVAAVTRMLGFATDTSALARAVFDGRPGHPVLIGSGHWMPLAATLAGDRGAGAYLAAHGAVEVECGDLYDGEDVDS
jgi:CTP:molybdopterin cytidylyltransferase MocA